MLDRINDGKIFDITLVDCVMELENHYVKSPREQYQTVLKRLGYGR
jgi:hypothetical protein